MTLPAPRHHSTSGAPGLRDRSMVLSWIGPLAVLLVAGLTALVILVGPDPHPSTDGTWLRNLDLTLVKPADRAALVSWIVLTVGLAIVALLLARRPATRRRPGSRALAAASGVAVALILAALLWNHDRFKLWLGLPTSHLVLGLAAAAALVTGLASTDRRWRLVGFVLAALVVALAFPSWVQTPSTVVDPVHFSYTSDELTSVAAGHFPLHDYFPQYTVVLPYLFAIPLALMPAHAPSIVLAGVLVLQMIAIAAAVTLPNLVAGRRFVASSIAVVVPAVFVPVATGTTPSSYFQGMPLRDVLPVLTILLAMLLLRGRPVVRWAVPWPWLAIGAASGLSALNNPDFGLAAAGAVAVTVVIVQRSWSDLVRALIPFGVGAVAPFGVYAAIGAINGTPVDWSSWLVFQEVFGPAGLANVPMGTFGLHIAFVSLFVAASVIGFVLVLTSPRNTSSFAFRQGLLLALTGGWSLLSLPYLAGRSVPSTYIGGFAFNAGLVTAAMLPLVAQAWRSARTWSSTDGRLLALALPLAAVGALLACIPLLPPPATRLTAIEDAGPAGRYALLADQELRLANAVPLDGGPSLKDTIAAGGVVQALPHSSLMALTSSIPSVSVASSPEYAEASWWFSQHQCAQPWAPGTEYLLVRTTTARILAADPACASYVDFSAMHLYGAAGQDGDDLTFAVLPVRQG